MKKYATTITVAIIVGVAAFYGGMTYGRSQAVTPSGQTFQRGGSRNGGGFGANNGGFASGQILSEDSQSITIELRNGSSTSANSTKIVFFSSSTAIMKMTNGTVADLQTGANVIVTGTPNADGSITAQSIQLRETLPGRGGQ